MACSLANSAPACGYEDILGCHSQAFDIAQERLHGKVFGPALQRADEIFGEVGPFTQFLLGKMLLLAECAQSAPHKGHIHDDTPPTLPGVNTFDPSENWPKTLFYLASRTCRRPRSPFERCWSTKASLRNVQARTREALEMAITQALATITAADAHGWFQHCGYGVH